MNSLKNLDQKLLLSSELDHFKISVRNVMQDNIILSSDLTSHGELPIHGESSGRTTMFQTFSTARVENFFQILEMDHFPK